MTGFGNIANKKSGASAPLIFLLFFLPGKPGTRFSLSLIVQWVSARSFWR